MLCDILILVIYSITICLSFSCDGILFFRVMLCFGSRKTNNIDNTPIFIVAAKQCYTEPRLFEGPKELGGNRIRTADLNRLKGYSIPCDIKQKGF